MPDDRPGRPLATTVRRLLEGAAGAATLGTSVSELPIVFFLGGGSGRVRCGDVDSRDESERRSGCGRRFCGGVGDVARRSPRPLVGGCGKEEGKGNLASRTALQTTL